MSLIALVACIIDFFQTQEVLSKYLILKYQIPPTLRTKLLKYVSPNGEEGRRICLNGQ